MIDNHLPKNVMGGGATPNPKTLMKELRKHYWKAFLALIKAYKRYYLGAWIIKLPFYKLTSNQHKFTKWQAKRDERLEFLHNALKTFKFLRVFYEESKKWLNSPEFKAKYLDTKHPYPPLFNPDSVDYKSIPAELAWELNLPLPPNYKFMFYNSGGSATTATMRFLTECDITVEYFHGSKAIYFGYFDILSKSMFNKNCLLFYGLFAFQLDALNSDSARLLNSFSLKTPLLHIARDPIEKLQHILNHIGDYSEIEIFPKIVNLTYDYNIMPKYTYIGGSATPTLNNLLDTHFLLECLLFNSMLNSLKDKVTSIHCIEFNDLKPDKAFDTFCKLADTLGFDKPTNKEIFTNRINRNRGALVTLPTTLYVHKDDLKYAFKEGQKEKRNLASLRKKGGFSIIITLPHYLEEKQKEFADISDEIEPNLIIDDAKICIIIDKNELIKLKENDELFKVSKDYLKGYVNALKDNAEQIKANLINETQIIEYLRCNDEARKNMKQILDTELTYIKTHHPNFIEKWKYYLEFEKMCAELDGEKDEK